MRKFEGERPVFNFMLLGILYGVLENTFSYKNNKNLVPRLLRGHAPLCYRLIPVVSSFFSHFFRMVFDFAGGFKVTSPTR